MTQLSRLTQGRDTFIPLQVSAPILNSLSREIMGQDLRRQTHNLIVEELVGFSVEYARTVCCMIITKQRDSNKSLMNFVDDVGQDVGLTVINKFHTYKGDSMYTSWLHRCALNQSIDYIRRHRGNSVHFGPDREGLVANEPRSREPSAVEQLEAREMWEAFWRARARLSESHREILELFDQELSYDQIAYQLEVPVGTVRSRLTRARSALAHFVEQEKPLNWFSTMLREAINKRSRSL